MMMYFHIFLFISNLVLIGYLMQLHPPYKQGLVLRTGAGKRGGELRARYR